MTYLCATHTVPTHTCWQQRTAIVLVWRADILYLMWMLHKQKTLKKPKKKEESSVYSSKHHQWVQHRNTSITYTQGKEITAPLGLGVITKSPSPTKQGSLADGRTDLSWWHDRSWDKMYSLRICVPTTPPASPQAAARTPSFVWRSLTYSVDVLLSWLRSTTNPNQQHHLLSPSGKYLNRQRLKESSNRGDLNKSPYLRDSNAICLQWIIW